MATSKQPKFETKWAVLKNSLAHKREESKLKYLPMHQFMECFTSSLVVNIELRTNQNGTQNFRTALFLRASTAEDHAGKSTVHITDSPETWHTFTTSLVH